MQLNKFSDIEVEKVLFSFIDISSSVQRTIGMFNLRMFSEKLIKKNHQGAGDKIKITTQDPLRKNPYQEEGPYFSCVTITR